MTTSLLPVGRSRAVGGEFQVNTYTTSFQSRPAAGPDGAGGFVVVWQSLGSNGTDSAGYSVQGQRFASDGSPAGDEFQVNSYTTSMQTQPAVGPDGAGGFVVTWGSDGSSGGDISSRSVQAQRFASDGTPAGDEFQVNTYTTSYQYRAHVGPDGGGGFVVVWDSDGSGGDDTSSFSVQGQRFGSDGSAKGSEFQVNTYTTSGQVYLAVGSDGAGRFIVVWDSLGSGGNDASGRSVQGQRMAPPEIFADGFESGDTSAWSNTVP